MNNDENRYKRPKNLDEFKSLLSEPINLEILAGGAFSPPKLEPAAVFVDIQDIGVDRIEKMGDTLRVGAAARLQQIMEADIGLDELRVPLTLEAAANVRGSLSLLNFLGSADLRSPFLAALMAFAPELEMTPSGKLIPLERYLPVPAEGERDFPLWMQMQLPVGFAWEYIARTPKDRPIISLAVSRKKDGGFRVVCGGDESFPRVIEQKTTAETLFALVRQAFEASGDAWASAEYRQEMSQVLLSRCLQRLEVNALRKEER